MVKFNFATNDFIWTTTPYDQAALNEMPFIQLNGWEQTWSDAINAINFWMEKTDEANEGNPYAGLYNGTLKSLYKFPYFNEYHHAISQSWQENQGPAGALAKKITDLVETVGKAVLPAAGILYPKSYAGAQAASYAVNFSLINTCDGNGGQIKNNIMKNKAFLEQFIKDNLHDQNGALSIVPPLIYEVLIPGVRWSPAAVIQGLNVTNKGSLNSGASIGLGGAYIYPDAWEISFTVQELINESKKIYNDALGADGIDYGITTRTF